MKTIIHTFNLFVFVVVSVLLYGCTHTNDLAQYNISASKILFKKYVSFDLSKVYVDINTGYGNDTKSIITVILGGLGSGYTEGQVEEKFRNAINGDSISNNVMSGIKDGLLTYYKIIPVKGLEEDPQYIMETQLLKFYLESNAYGIYVKARTKAILTDRNTARTVWENDETSSVPINDVYIPSFGSQTIQTTKSIINAIRLMNMSEEELRYAINETAEEVGRMQSETLRKDIADR
jgi:hypothetical protein